MTSQFVDLFDKEKYGIAYWAVIMAVVGSLVLAAFNAGETAYNILVRDWAYTGPDGEPMALGSWLLGSLRWTLPGAIGFGTILVASATLMKRDLHLPFAAGILSVAWWMVIRLSGIVDAPAFDLWNLATDFGGIFLSLGTLVVLYRLLNNKLMALSLGMAFGGVLQMTISALRFGYPLELYAEFLAKELFLGLILGVFIFAGIAKHFSTRGMYFGEFGLDAADSSKATPATDPTMGKTRRPLVTILLMLVTLNLYTFGWVYKTFKEIRQRDSAATEIPEGRALGFLFIPIFNFFWVIRIFYEIPRAIERLGRADPPAGHSLPAGLVTGCMAVAIVAGFASNFWFPALYLNGAFLWTSVLLAQSSLNSHWHAHRTAEDTA